MTNHITFEQLQRFLKYKRELRKLMDDRTMPERITGHGVIVGHKKLTDEEIRKLGLEMWNLEDFLSEVHILPTQIVTNSNGKNGHD